MAVSYNLYLILFNSYSLLSVSIPQLLNFVKNFLKIITILNMEFSWHPPRSLDKGIPHLAVASRRVDVSRAAATLAVVLHLPAPPFFVSDRPPPTNIFAVD